MDLVRVSSQLLVSVLFVAVPPNTENSKKFFRLVIIQCNAKEAQLKQTTELSSQQFSLVTHHVFF